MLGFCKSAMDWDLGVGQKLSLHSLHSGSAPGIEEQKKGPHFGHRWLLGSWQCLTVITVHFEREQSLFHDDRTVNEAQTFVPKKNPNREAKPSPGSS